MKKVYTARSLPDAHLLKGLLEGIDIEAEVQGEQGFQITGQVPSKLMSPTVWVVNDEDYDRARELVSSFREESFGTSFEGYPWRCSCGEENEGQFTECWNCGKSRPS